MTGRSILIVDDDELLCDMIAALLELEGHAVAVAHDGDAGLALCRRRRFDCILLDLVMPRMDGLLFMRTIAAELPDHPPIVVMSASVTADIIAEGRDYGVRSMIRKPVDAARLLGAVAAAFAPLSP